MIPKKGKKRNQEEISAIYIIQEIAENWGYLWLLIDCKT